MVERIEDRLMDGIEGFADWMRSARTRAGLTQEELAERAGVSCGLYEIRRLAGAPDLAPTRDDRWRQHCTVLQVMSRLPQLCPHNSRRTLPVLPAGTRSCPSWT